jgi:hypothetical protein
MLIGGMTLHCVNYIHYTRGGVEVVTSIFFSESIITVTMKLKCMMGMSFTKLRLFVHKVSLIINTLFPTLRETLYARHVKFFVEA